MSDLPASAAPVDTPIDPWGCHPALGCLDHNTVAGYFDGQLPVEQLQLVETHLDACAACRRHVSDLALTSLGADGSGAGAAAADRMGRYAVLRPLGDGGMGIVLLAYDPELDRRVALKVLHTELDAAAGSEAQAMLQREAQTMARLEHPNVITVFDVGASRGGLFVAMEYVDGWTLDAWCRQPGRGWREILVTCIAAGRGLAAAHRAGIVHRDFKPANVLIGRDGRVRVSDFGLARAIVGEHAHRDPDREFAAGSPVASTKGMAGTPAYMAPEQLEGGAADEASDQFSFCVAVFEQLFQRRPFEGRTLRELATAIRAGDLHEPRSSPVPARIRAALRRGLRPEPSRRHASMEALLVELERALRSRRRVLLAAVGIAGLGIAVGVAAAERSRAHEAMCVTSAKQLAGAWDPARREALRAAIGGSELGATMLPRIEAALDAYGRTWTELHQQVCEATHVRREQSPGLLDARMSCFGRRREELRAVVDLLVTPGVATPAEASIGVHRLESPRGCTTISELDAASAEEPSPRVLALRRRVADARALQWLGKLTQASEVTSVLIADAAELGDRATEAEALWVHGLSLANTGQPKQAEQALVRAADLAARRLDLARAWVTLVAVVGTMQARHAEALVWAHAARRELVRAGGDDELEGTLAMYLGMTEVEATRYDEAARAYADAMASRMALYGPEHTRVAEVLGAQSQLHAQRGDVDQALELSRRALDIYRAAVGPDHPLVAGEEANLGNLILGKGQIEEAVAQLERAVTSFERAAGPSSAGTGSALAVLGWAYLRAGRMADARAAQARALAIEEAALGPEHPGVAARLTDLASILDDSGETEEAVALYRRAIAVLEKTSGRDHLNLASPLFNLAETLRTANRCAEAMPLQQRALEIWQSVGPEHLGLGYALTGLGECEIELGHFARAISLLERGVRIRTQAGVDPELLGLTRFELARALWGSGQRRRGLQLARETAAAVTAHAPNSEVAQGIERWIADRPKQAKP